VRPAERRPATLAVVASMALTQIAAAADFRAATQPGGIDPVAIGAPDTTAALSDPLPVLLLDRSLNQRAARLVSVNAAAIVIADDRGRTVSVSPSEFIAIVAAPQVHPLIPSQATNPFEPDDPIRGEARPLGQPDPATGALRPDAALTNAAWSLSLTDGQRLFGTPVTTATPDAVAFRADRLGIIEIPLERVATIERRSADTTPAPETLDEDALTLANGDELRGFILAMGAAGVEFERADGSIAAFELSRVRRVALANPPEPSRRPLAQMTTGEVFAAQPAAVGPDPAAVPCVLLLPDLLRTDLDSNAQSPAQPGPVRGARTSSEDLARSLCIPPLELRSLALPSRRVTPLASIEPSRVTPSADRRRTDPPHPEPAGDARLAPSLLFSGPMTATWPLPPDASAIVFDARLGGAFATPDAPPGPWADAVLRVHVRTDRGRTTLAEHRLWSSQGRARISAPLPETGTPDRELIIELDAASFGPVQDRLLLVRPLLVDRN
jgi:hypothetical protein